MAHQVMWSHFIVDEFEKSVILTDFEKKILHTRVFNQWSISQQAMEFHTSESTVNRTIAKLKKKYDYAQRMNPSLPKRKTSKQEEWMDSH